MPTSGGTPAAPGQRAGGRLPASTLAGLRTAFAAELAERLPRLRAAAAELHPDQLTDALRDVHTLGSSASVVGAPAAATTARAAEAALLDGRVAEFAALAAELDLQLSRWAP